MEGYWDEQFDKAVDPDAGLDVEEFERQDALHSSGSFLKEPKEELPEEFFDPGSIEEDDGISEDLRTLISLGKLTDHFTFWGHSFDIRTLRIGEELEIGLLTDRWKDSNEAGRAYATAVVAAALTRIDGNPIVVPLGPDDKELISQKFDYIVKRLHWPIIRRIYEQYLVLVERQQKSLEELQKK